MSEGKETTEREQPGSSAFDEFDFYGHFGRYEGSRGAPAPRHAFLVGRGRERAHFLDLLYMKSGLGSYLITGVRGVGKTSFVRHCLDTYERDVYERYCRSAVGRSAVDKLLAYVALALPFFVFLVLSSTMFAFTVGEWQAPLANLVMVGLGALLGFMVAAPLVWAFRTRRSFVAYRRWNWLSRGLWWALAGLPFAVHAFPAASERGASFWLLAAEGALLAGGVAWLSRQRHDGWEHTSQRRQQALWRASLLGGVRLVVLASISAALFGALCWPLRCWQLELLAIGAGSVAIPCLLYFEKLWLLQPTRRMVFDTAIHPLGDTPGERRETDESERIACSVEDTLFYALFRRWLPIVRVGINLGLDRLSHRHIIESMLRGLRAQLRPAPERRFGVAGYMRAVAVTAVWLFSLHVTQLNLLQFSAVFSFEQTLRLCWIPPRSLAALLIPHDIELLWAVLLWACLLPLSKWIIRSPHHQARRDILWLLDRLSSRVTLENKSTEAKLGTSQENVLTMPTRLRKVETDPQDPRSLEQAFLMVLDAIRKPTHTLVPGLRLSLPAPETIFVFDELDKVGTTTTLLDPGLDATEGHVRDVERQRSRKLQALLSDLKNLLSTAPARFVFVGGRNLHDEWLADEVNRQPLLSNIFDAEIYLRTFLTDNLEDDTSMSDDDPRELTDRNGATGARIETAGAAKRFSKAVGDYFDAQYLRAMHTWSQWGSSAGAGRRDADLHVLAPAYQRGRTRRDRPACIVRPELRSLLEGEPIELPAFWDAFICFLTFRSRGIPRRARLILEAFVRPYDRVATTELRQGDRPAQHVLYFEHGDRVRVELVSELFRAIERSPSSLEWRDDKLLMAVFQFADFLTRFHRRAFSLQSLERFEELMHVHRAPDTGTLAARLIADWLGTLLEPTGAGIHAYRFRIEWAAEITNLSSLSQHESASANFSLDEAQALKSQLRALLVEVKESGGAFEVHTALAELHDLDGDHLDARHNFRRAIEILDARLRQEFVEGGDDGHGAVARLLERAKTSADGFDRQLDWALARLRVMLQLGLTYERTFDYERAGLEYGNALQVARAICSSTSELRLTLKSSSTALVEPIFAQAWAILKDPTVTTAPFDTAHGWVRSLVLQRPTAGVLRWDATQQLPASELAPALRELTMLGDLAFFSVPRWRSQLRVAVAAYRLAWRVADYKWALANDDEPPLEPCARIAFSLALCELVSHREEEEMDIECIRRFARLLSAAQRLAVEAPSSQGPFADSMAIHLLGLEMVEEIWLLARACRQDGERGSDELRSALLGLLTPPTDESKLAPLRRRMLNDARWRLRDLQPEWARQVPLPSAFPARNRFLNFRSVVAVDPQDPVAAQRLVRMWRRFDSRATLAPCRLAVALPPGVDAAPYWHESADVSDGGKHYFAWLRDRYYLDDGFGPMLFRANFALTLGFAGVHRSLARRRNGG